MSEKTKIQLGDRKTEGPIYAQVRKQFETLIANKEFASGEALPSPVVLAKQLEVDKGEIQRAYFELEMAGLVKKRSGKDFLGKEKITYQVS